MPSQTSKMSVVLPVRDGEHRIASRVERVLEVLSDMTRDASEVVVVDDGSKDTTPEVLEELKSRYPQVRVVRHSRPRGLEAAGQTGLERATGDLVFIQETDSAATSFPQSIQMARNGLPKKVFSITSIFVVAKK